MAAAATHSYWAQRASTTKGAAYITAYSRARQLSGSYNLRDYLCDYSMSPFFMWTHFLLLLSGKYPKGLDIMAINDEPAPRLIDEAWKAVRNRSVLNQGRCPRRYNDGQLSGRLHFDNHYHNTSYCLPISRRMCYYAH